MPLDRRQRPHRPRSSLRRTWELPIPSGRSSRSGRSWSENAPPACQPPRTCSPRPCVLGAFTIVQAFLLVLIGTARQGGPAHGAVLSSGRVELFLVAALSGVAAMALGLLISALVTNADKALTILPVILFAQFLLTGGLFNVRTTPGLEQLSYVTSAHWGYSAAASTANLDLLQGDGCNGTGPLRVGASFCDPSHRHDVSTWVVDMGALAGLTLLCLGGTWARVSPIGQPRRSKAAERPVGAGAGGAGRRDGSPAGSCRAAVRPPAAGRAGVRPAGLTEPGYGRSRGEVDRHLPDAQPLAGRDALRLLAIGDDGPRSLGQVAQHEPAGLLGVRFYHAGDSPVVPVTGQVVVGDRRAFAQHQVVPIDVENRRLGWHPVAVPAGRGGLVRVPEQRRVAAGAHRGAVVQAEERSAPHPFGDPARQAGVLQAGREGPNEDVAKEFRGYRDHQVSIGSPGEGRLEASSGLKTKRGSVPK